MEESEDSFSVKAEIPGFSQKELEVSIEPGRVTITGKATAAFSSAEASEGPVSSVLTETIRGRLCPLNN